MDPQSRVPPVRLGIWRVVCRPKFPERRGTILLEVVGLCHCGLTVRVVGTGEDLISLVGLRPIGRLPKLLLDLL